MCARLLACPLCSQPGFATLDALRAGLVSVATRPLSCPVCNEVLLGIDKLTIHLFGHTINQGQAVVGGGNDAAKIAGVVNNTTQTWKKGGQDDNTDECNGGNDIYIPIDEIATFGNFTTIEDGTNVITVNSDTATVTTSEMKASSNQVIYVQNVTATQPKVISASIISQQDPETLPPGIYRAVPTSSTSTNDDSIPMERTNRDVNEARDSSTNDTDKTLRDSYNNSVWTTEKSNAEQSSEYQTSHTNRLADLVKNARITSSPLGTYHKSYDCSKPITSNIGNRSEIVLSRVLTAAERMERCNICGFTFPDRNILILHKQLVHMVQEKDANLSPESIMKNYPCHLCTKVFKMRGSLMVHMRVAHPGFNCARGEQSKDQSNDGDTREPENGYNCPVCGQNFKKEQHVTQHLKIHDGKQWACDVCSKMFTTRYFLKKHKRLHSGEMPYKCNICDKSFTFQQSYHKHRLYHKDDKPHTCATCGRSFKELSTLHNHERIHTGEKPFACETCGKRFRQRVSYLVHRRIHTGVMPYKCTACGKSFRYKVSQRTHKCPQQPTGPPTQQSDNINNTEVTKMQEIQENQSQDNVESMDTPVVSEENQYVLIINEKGHHVLKRKKDVNECEEQKKTENNTERAKEKTSESNEFMPDAWNRNTTDRMEFKEPNDKTDDIVSSVIQDSCLWNGTSNNKDDSQTSNDSITEQFSVKELTGNIWNRSTITDTTDKEQTNNDFFSLVISPLENGISSPSTEMEHLNLSSPVNNKEHSSEANDCFPPMDNNTNAVQVHHNGIEGSFTGNNVNLSTLQTINEDSLKELLYSITDKQ